MDYVGWNLKVITENVLYKTFLESITIKGGKKVSISRRMLVGIIVVVIAIIVVVAFVAVSPVTRPQKVWKAAFIYDGPIGDAGWTWNHEQSRKAIEKEFKITTAYSENVAAADAPRVMEEYIAKGYNIIIINDALEVYDPTYSVPKAHPDVYFMHCSGYFHDLPNVASFYGRIYEVRYLNGIVAGLMTKTNKIGYVAAFPIPDCITGLNAFTLGLRSVNPNATVHVTFTHSWYDPGAEKMAADSLISIGCDVLTQHCDSPAVQQAAEEAGIYSLGYQSDLSRFAPHAYLTGCIWNWTPVYEEMFNSILEGRFVNKWYYPGMKEGVCIMGPWNPVVPTEVREYVENVKQQIISGEFQIWKGPIYDREGNLRIPEGYVPTDDEVWQGMYWVVPGVVGEIPPPPS